MGSPPPLERKTSPAAGRCRLAVAHGDERVIKFTDTAIGVYGRTGLPGALAAAVRTTTLISPAT
jgi:hypothetical protein